MKLSGVGDIYDIGPFRLDATIGALTRDGVPAPLGYRASRVLKTLVESPNEFISKDALLERAWPGIVVEEGNLAVQISAIRRAFSREPGGDGWIETRSRRGYRFVGPVREVAAAQAGAPGEGGSNLPRAATPFIGRERERVDVAQLLAAQRLVTIVGPGGIGKTRLALQVAAGALGAYRHGVWFVELGATHDPPLVPAAVARVFGITDTRNRSVVESLCGFLAARRALLIMDNCEHVRGASSAVADALLNAAPGCTLLATSREPLAVTGEQIYPLQPLSLPERGAGMEAIARSDAVRLFVERARAHLPGFELTADRAAAIAELCIHLDGLPLALELAAGRLSSFSVEEIGDRLGNRLQLLTGGSGSLPRHETLRATLDWSHDLLGEEERVVLRRLAVFPGSFGLEAAKRVAFDAQVDELAVLDALAQLIARSLLVADTSAARTRYRLLETTRAYAFERLEAADEGALIAQRHAAYFRELFERAHESWMHTPDAEWLALYAPELENLRAALAYALAPEGDTSIGIELAGASGHLWAMLGFFSEGVLWLKAAGASVRSGASPRDEARLWSALGRLVDEAPTEAEPLLERAVMLYRGLDDPLGFGLALARWARVLAFSGRFDEAEKALAEALPSLERAGEPRGVSFYFFNRAFLKGLQADLAAARPLYERALELYRESGYELGELATIGNLANITWAMGDLDATVAAFRRQVAALRKSATRTRRLLGWALASLSGALTDQGALQEALEAAREGLPMLAEDGSAWIFTNHVALRAARAGKLANAARLAGYSDHVWAKKGATRHPVEAALDERLRAILREKIAPEELERLMAQGANMSQQEAIRVALE